MSLFEERACSSFFKFKKDGVLLQRIGGCNDFQKPGNDKG